MSPVYILRQDTMTLFLSRLTNLKLTHYPKLRSWNYRKAFGVPRQCEVCAVQYYIQTPMADSKGLELVDKLWFLANGPELTRLQAARVPSRLPFR